MCLHPGAEILPGKKICVYCGSKTGFRPLYAAAARELGSTMARRGIGLVYGGGNVGLMGLLADAALQGGAEVIGVIPRPLANKELAHQSLNELIVVENMHQRKAIMGRRSNAFVALPGGYGTLEELFEAVAWSQLGIHCKPLGLLNTAGYFGHLLAFLDQAVREDFLRPHHRSLLRVEETIDSLLDNLLAACD